MTPPARLLRLHHRHLTNVLVLGGSAADRLRIAKAFHHESPVARGPFVHLEGGRDGRSLRASLESRIAWIDHELAADPVTRAEHGTLFVDSVGMLSADTQRLLLSWLVHSADRASEDAEAGWSGRLVAGNGEHLMHSVIAGRFSEALLDTLDKVRVDLDAVAGRATREHPSRSQIAV